ncbi:universal stress protein [Hymenobacter arizonensis]|uniref:Nucleotide-binding universal stress protein, UspA family n=1 Tax=Hymenobacter arizonensis TaxID=1227077 RepID=A0A1I5U3J2_HYMAR|nr:universal stress protein [Hymenobacter arizonensis]SFP89116.1 Nucleotide-binding universal stress protein, UspA family [Hymenobacter arizonensis]
MKTILVPIDHTASAEHTLAYANKLAVRWPAEVVLLYCHQLNAAAGEPATALLAQEQRLRGLVERLRYQQLTRQNGRRIQYRYRVLAGCLHDHVQAEATACAADLMVMGLEHIDCGQEVAPGNHAATITALVSCPVLVVPAGRRSLPNRLVFSADFDALNLHLLPRLSGLASAFPAPLDLVQFYPHAARARRRQLKQALGRAASQLTWPTITEHLVEDEAPLEGVSEYCARTQAQLLIIAPTDTAQLLRYFDLCYTQTQAYHTQIPVLVLRATEQPAADTCCEHCHERLAQEAAAARLAAYRAVVWA